MKRYFTLFKVSMAVLAMALAFNLVLVFNPYFDPVGIARDLISDKGNPSRNEKTPGNNNSNNSNNSTIDSKASVRKMAGGSGTEYAQPQPSNGGASKSSIPNDTGKNTNSDKKDVYFMTFSEISSMENMSMTDKLAGLSIVGKLASEDIDMIWSLAEDGVTYEEMEEIKKILEKKLTPSEIGKLQEILDRNKKLANR